MKTKTLDCVEMKRRGAAKIAEETAGMSTRQKIEYWQKLTQAFRERQKHQKRRTGKAQST
jgi:hypothetical protein